MTEINKPRALLSLLKSYPSFQNISDEIIQWLIDKSDYICYEKGETYFKPGDSVDEMLIVIEGEYVLEFEQQGVRREVGGGVAGEITGLLPFSRLKEANGFGVVISATHTKSGRLNVRSRTGFLSTSLSR